MWLNKVYRCDKIKVLCLEHLRTYRVTFKQGMVNIIF